MTYTLFENDEWNAGSAYMLRDSKITRDKLLNIFGNPSFIHNDYLFRRGDDVFNVCIGSNEIRMWGRIGLDEFVKWLSAKVNCKDEILLRYL